MLVLKDAILNRKKWQAGPFSLKIQPGQIWGVVGLNGSGKSTLLHLLAGLILPQRGSLTLDKTPFSKFSSSHWARQVGWIGRLPHIHFRFKVQTLLEMGRFPHADIPNLWVQDAAERFSLTRYLQVYLDELSDGEKQRVMLAKSWIQQPQYWILDEPFDHLDIPYQAQLINQFKIEAQNGRAIVCVSHQVRECLTWATHVVFIKSGKILASGPILDMDISSWFQETFGVLI